ncbi:MAG: glutamate racemase [Lachnospiraceae bacterium]|nr:glutamate racemase [Lachnospiraceae bacterium]
MNSNLPIGVFDSGVGGLTVAKEIMSQLPDETICYFGDTARVPYGNKSQETVIKYSRQIASFLLDQKVKAIVIACNTASAFALETLQREVSVPVIGVVKPGARSAAEVSKNGRIGVIGTEGTVRSGLYGTYIRELRPEVQVFGQACPLFVPLAEEGLCNDEVTMLMARRYLAPLLEQGVDTIVLGCTHYPLLRGVVGHVAGPNVTLVNPAFETAKDLKELLTSRGMCAESGRTPEHRFYVSDGAEQFRAFANSILPCEMIETDAVTVKVFA